MLRLPARFAAVILCFAPLLRERSWRHAEVLLIGAILVPGQRTVTSILRIAGLCRERRFARPPRRGDPAPVVGQGDRPHHALPARAVLDRGLARHTAGPPRTPAGLGHGLVPQGAPDLLRHPRRGAAPDLDRAGFGHLPAFRRDRETPSGAPRRHRPRALPCRMNGQTRANSPLTKCRRST